MVDLKKNQVVSISRYGVITFCTRFAFAILQSSSLENRRSRNPYLSASSATSSPILCRYLKQSAMVRAGLLI
jgi:hypothetical protein